MLLSFASEKHVPAPGPHQLLCTTYMKSSLEVEGSLDARDVTAIVERVCGVPVAVQGAHAAPAGVATGENYGDGALPSIELFNAAQLMVDVYAFGAACDGSLRRATKGARHQEMLRER